MVVDSSPTHTQPTEALTDEDVDRLFRALADATRRDILRRTMAASASVSELAGEYDMSFAAVQKHVAVLEHAGLVSKEVRGRQRRVNAEPDRLARARELLTRLEDLWRTRFGQLDAVLAAPLPERAPEPDADPDPDLP